MVAIDTTLIKYTGLFTFRIRACIRNKRYCQDAIWGLNVEAIMITNFNAPTFRDGYKPISHQLNGGEKLTYSLPAPTDFEGDNIKMKMYLNTED